MTPTKSKYSKVEKNGKPAEKGFHGMDYLKHWSENNIEESLEYERRDRRQRRTAAAGKSQKK
jgi:hypothetical protein